MHYKFIWKKTYKNRPEVESGTSCYSSYNCVWGGEGGNLVICLMLLFCEFVARVHDPTTTYYLIQAA